MEFKENDSRYSEEIIFAIKTDQPGSHDFPRFQSQFSTNTSQNICVNVAELSTLKVYKTLNECRFKTLKLVHRLQR